MNQMRDEDLSNASLAVLSRLVQLTSLNLSGHVGLSSQGLSSTSRLYRLQALDLSGELPFPLLLFPMLSLGLLAPLSTCHVGPSRNSPAPFRHACRVKAQKIAA